MRGAGHGRGYLVWRRMMEAVRSETRVGGETLARIGREVHVD